MSVFVHVRLKIGANALYFFSPPKYHSTTAARFTSDLRSDVSNRVENHTKKKKNKTAFVLNDQICELSLDKHVVGEQEVAGTGKT